MSDTSYPHLVSASAAARLSPAAVQRAFDPTRLTQARTLAGFTKTRLSRLIGVSAAAITQYELGANRPRPDVLPVLAEVLGVPVEFFVAGRPHGRLDSSGAHFRSLRSTRAYQRAKATAFTEQVWELTYVLEKRVQLPLVDLPGFAGGEVSSEDLPQDPIAMARMLRHAWGLGTGPINHFVRRMEAHGIVVVTPPPDPDLDTVDAYSTSRLPRPIVVLTANRTDDVYRHRFTAAHELGHLLLHGDLAPGDAAQEREADVFAAEFLTPRNSILPHLPRRLDLPKLAELRRIWGVSVDSLIYRSRELGLLSDSAVSRAYQRLHALRSQPGFECDPLTGYPGEQPVMLARAFSLACEEGLTLTGLARELAWPVTHLQNMLRDPQRRPVLSLVY